MKTLILLLLLSAHLPESTDAEKSLLANAIAHAHEVLTLCQEKGITEAHFSDAARDPKARHGGRALIFATINRLWREKKIGIFYGDEEGMEGAQSADYLILTQQLKDDGVLAECGGREGIFDLRSTLISASSAGAWIDTILDKAHRRELIRMCEEMKAKASQPRFAVDALHEEIRSRAASLGSLAPAVSETEATFASLDRDIREREEGAPPRDAMRTGIEPWDRIMGGVYRSEETVLAGPPGCGKTAMAEQIAEEVIRYGGHVAFFQRDMSLKGMLGRMACRRAGVWYNSYQKNPQKLDPRDLPAVRKAFEELYAQRSQIHLYRDAANSVQAIDTMVRRLKRKHDLSLWILDHFLMLRNNNGKDEFKADTLTWAAKSLRATITETEVPGIILSHVTVEKGGRPRASDVKFCKALYDDADNVVILSPEVDPITLSVGQPLPVSFLVDKNRNGAQQEEDLQFERELMRHR